MAKTRAADLDRIAARAIAAKVPIRLDGVTDGTDTAFTMSRKALEKGLLARGIVLSADDMLTTETARLAPPTVEYAAFAPAVLMQLQAGDRPIDTDELLAKLALPDTEIPFVWIKRHLKNAGLFHFPGIGWWHAPQWRDINGRLHHASGRERINIVVDLFNEHGWPLHDQQIAELSGGKITPKFFDPNREAKHGDYLRNIGMRLIVPAAEAKISKVPMWPPLARAMLDVGKKDILTARQYRVQYLLAVVMSRHGLAEVTYGNTRRGGARTRTLRMQLTPAGRTELERLAHAATRDALEVV